MRESLDKRQEQILNIENQNKNKHFVYKLQSAF